MPIFDFLRKLFSWTDQSSRKRKADTFSIEEGIVSPKKHHCDHSTCIEEEYFDIDDESDNEDIQIIKEKITPITPCTRMNGTRGKERKPYHLYSPCSSIVRNSYPHCNRNKLNMGYFSNRNHKIPNNSMDYNCPTLKKTHRLKEKGQYEQLLQLFLPAQRIDVLESKEIGERLPKAKPEVIDLEDSESPSPSSYKTPSPSTSKMVSKFLFGASREQPKKDNEKTVPLKEMKKDEVMFLGQTQLRKQEHKDQSVLGKSVMMNHIESVPTNSLRDKLAAKAVVKADFVPQVAKRYNERMEQGYKEAERCQKMYLLTKHNRLAQETAREVALEEQLIRSMRLYEIILEEQEEPKEEVLPTLTNDMLKEIQNALIPKPPDEVLVEGFGLRITRKDIHTLADLNWLNDEVINYYMNLLIARGTEDKYPKVHAMNTFFYPKLISSGHASLKRWTRKIDIFAQDIVVVPIHLGIHWCMSIIDFRNKTIRYYDSMGSSNMKCLSALRQYLEEESLDKKKKPYDTNDWTLESAKDIPQQMNGSDCGVFSCMFAEYICANKKITFSQKDMPYFRQKMVYEILKTKLL